MAAKVQMKSREELAEMHTGSLMSRREALLKCDESSQASTRSTPGLIEFKNTAEWKQAYSDLKSALATREHIPNKQERKALRQQRAKTKTK